MSDVLNCEQHVPRTIETKLVSISGKEVVVIQRQLTTAELWRAEEESGARPNRINKARLSEYMSHLGKSDMSELTPEERAEIYTGDIWIPGDDSTTPAGRKQLILQVAYSMGYLADVEGVKAGWSVEGKPSPEAILNLFSESQTMLLIANITKLRELDYTEEKNC
jgi:hypothetical protein